ncbi:TPA: M48 family metallopeptidase [Pseudomonas aeruginosa]|uniref:M48 family metallopeptidase n=1 Tax=Pseudomonas aeruginosa TaxID=287 RepID=UPI00053E80F6|nr:M48 family metallopeptidase [Pseudomonas aeruginosa]MBI9183429.1 M48 family metallopeptidase [Pseudomonas aeruginosa]HCF7540541.1 M48 family metallopeptidase [Pseudomonas aeruginosa]HCF9365838.1 M48 family metallopeptidase [Pseudomonas aeruginosa]HCF9372160.1 M48 family metallopeptidase [Pseudomonas aeruginosa]HCF9376245.1 M48 family metallopeptidase [Pseudomonas aeruginosa]
MSRLGLLGLIALTFGGCAQIKMPAMPLAAPKVDPNISQYAAHFTGPAGNQSNIAPATPQSTQQQKRAQGIAPNPDIDKYLNEVLARLQKSLPGTPTAARVYATPNTEFGANSYQDGGIYISYKALGALESEDELAAVIAHEYSHVLLQHYQTNWIDSAANMAFSAGNLYINRQLKTATDTDLLRMMVTNNAALEVSQIGLVPALTRDQENEADQLGMDLLLRANYSFVGALDFLSRMQQWDALNEEIQQKRKTNYIDLFAPSENSVIAKAIDGQLDLLENKFAQLIHRTSLHHDNGEERSKTLRTYLKRHYAHADRPALRSAPYVQVMQSKNAKDFFAGLDLTHASVDALQQRDFPQALAAAQTAGTRTQGSVAFTDHALINALALNGKRKEALALLEQKVASGDALYADNMLMLAALKGSYPDKALTLAQRSYDSYDSPPELLPDLISLNKQQKNQMAVIKYYGVCASKALSTTNSKLLDNCNKAKG